MAENDSALVPDMRAAGVDNSVETPPLRGAASYATLPNSLVETLGTQRNMEIPPSLMSAMTQQPAFQANPWLAMSAGVGQALAGRTGNPYLESQQKAFAQQQEQQRGAGSAIYKMQKDQQARNEKALEAEKTLSVDLLKSENTEAQQMGAKGMSLYYQKTLGKSVSPKFFIEATRLTDDERKNAELDLHGGMTNEQVIERNPKVARLAPGWLETTRSLVRDPAYMSARGWKGRAEIDADTKKRADDEKKRADEQIERDLKKFRTLVPELTDEQAPYVAEFIRSKTGGPLQGVDTTTPEGRALIAQGRTHADRRIDLEKEKDVRRKAKGEAGPKLSDENSIRQQYNTLSKDFVTIRDSYQRIGEASKSPSAAGDLALIFNYMKMLDPGSVVRESEFATAAAAGGYGERFQAAAQRILSGERLSPEMRKDFITQARGQFEAQRKGQLQVEKEYRRIATLSGMDPDRTVPDYLGNLRGAKPGTPLNPAQPTGAASSAVPPGKVVVRSKEGQLVTIPRENLAEAQRRGAVLVR